MKSLAKSLVALTLLVLALSSCSLPTVERPVHQDYDQYLVKNQGVDYGKINQPASFYLDAESLKYRVEFRSGMSGRANLWIVEFGKVLEDTLASQDFKTIFPQVTRTDNPAQADGLVISLAVKEYKFISMAAHVTLVVKASKGGQVIQEKTYQKVGKSQGGKMVFGGGFAMKNAVQQSTKSAMDQIIQEIVMDLGKVL